MEYKPRWETRDQIADGRIRKRVREYFTELWGIKRPTLNKLIRVHGLDVTTIRDIVLLDGILQRRAIRKGEIEALKGNRRRK